jgi:glycosyltransferase involved in cell wall biosynthesis
MKILQISPSFFPAISIGGPIFSTLTFTEILEKNHQVTTLTTQQGLDNEQLKSITYNSDIQLSDNHTKIYKKFIGPANFTFSFSLLLWIIRHAKSYDLIVLQGIWNFPFMAAYLVARFHKIPYIVFTHGTFNPESFHGNSTLIKKLSYALSVKRMLMDANHVFFTTHVEQKKLIDFLKIKVNATIIPNIVKKQDFENLPTRGKFRKQLSIRPETTAILHFGRIAKIKGIEITLNAIKKLSDLGQDVCYIIAGGDEKGYLATIETKIDSLHIRDKVHFTGMLNREETKQIMVDSDIFVLSSYSENFGISAVEAMYCKLPVILANQVGIAEDVQNARAGLVFDIAKEELDRSISYLIENPSNTKVLAEQGYQFACKHYDLPVVAAQIDHVLQNIPFK